jgi:hypothetical protein
MFNGSRLVALILGSALASQAALAADLPAATYKVSNVPYTLSFDGQGQFHVDQGQNSQVKGSYTVKGDQLQLTDISGPWACSKSAGQTGTYRFRIEGGALMLNVVSDKCADRINSLVNLKWQQQ